MVELGDYTSYDSGWQTVDDFVALDFDYAILNKNFDQVSGIVFAQLGLKKRADGSFECLERGRTLSATMDQVLDRARELLVSRGCGCWLDQRDVGHRLVALRLDTSVPKVLKQAIKSTVSCHHVKEALGLFGCQLSQIERHVEVQGVGAA